MSRSFRAIAAAAVLSAATAAAAQNTPSPPQKPAPQQRPQQQKPPANEINPIGQPINVRLELTIVDQAGPGEPAKKTVSMILADRANGSVRTGSTASGAKLNVDATPHILPNGNIRMLIGIEYSPRSLSTKEYEAGGLPPSVIYERVTTVLEPGKPMVISQAADAASDRKTTVEVRATVIK